MAQPLIQPSFAAGELSPNLYSRVDLAKFHIGAALLRNFFVDYRGGASNRAGTIWVGRCKAGGTGAVRNISFRFSTLQAYTLEFGNLYMRVIKNGGYVLEPSANITAATKANPCGITTDNMGFSAGNLANGDWVYITGVTGMTQLNGKVFIAQNVDIPSKTCTLRDLDGNTIDATAWTAYAAGGTFSRIFTLVTTYADTDLAMLKFTQSADTMTLTHTVYATRQLTRTAHWAWTIAAATFSAAVTAPAGQAIVTTPGAGATQYSYVITAVDGVGRESVASGAATTAVAATMSSTAGSFNAVSWGAVAGALYYNVYRQREVPGAAAAAGDQYGFVGSTTTTAFDDHNILPDFSNTPPQNINPFAAGNNPGCVAYFQQRETFAGSTSGPQTIWMSRSGDYLNMNYSLPSKDDDAITETIASQQMNAIKHLVPMNSLIALTAGGAWRIDGGSQSDVITPSKFVATPQSFNGCSDVPPIVVNYDILYVQARGNTVRDLAYNFYVNVYTGIDLSVMANHLFFGRSISEWCYAEEPYKIIWAVRDDGQLLSLTYLKEQEVNAWAHSDTLGAFRSICSIPEGNEDAIYVVVQRKIGGKYVSYQERFASRNFEDNILGAPNPPWFVDCGLSYPLTYLAAGVTPDAGWGNGVTFTADANVFTAGMVGSMIQINGGSGVVATYVGPTQVTVDIKHPLNSVFPAISGAWSCTAPVQTITGLDHLLGQSVVALADGNVVTGLTVTTLSPGVVGVVLPQAASNIIIGLKFQAQFKSLYLDVPGESPTVQGKRINFPACTLRVVNTRGCKVGTRFDNPSTLREMRERTAEPYYLPPPLGDVVNTLPIKMQTALEDPTPLITGDERIGVEEGWDVDSQICVQQDNPLPVTILATIPEVVEGDTP